MHGRAQGTFLTVRCSSGLFSDGEVCFWQCVLSAFTVTPPGKSRTDTPDGTITWQLLVRRCERASAGVAQSSLGGSCSTAGSQPLTTCFQKSQLLCGWRGQGRQSPLT